MLSLQIDPPELVLPSISPPTVYMHEDQKQRLAATLYQDKAKAAKVKNPPPPGMTFKQQLAREEAERQAEIEKQKKWA